MSNPGACCFNRQRRGTSRRLVTPAASNYNDIQLAFTRLHHSDHRQEFVLKRALEHLQLPFDEEPNHAADDSWNTTKIFASIFSKINWSQITPLKKLYVSEVIYSTGHEENLPFNWQKCWEWHSSAVPYLTRITYSNLPIAPSSFPDRKRVPESLHQDHIDLPK